MACRESEFIEAFTAGQLPPEGVLGLEIHLERCEECFALVAKALALAPEAVRQSLGRSAAPGSRVGFLLSSAGPTDIGDVSGQPFAPKIGPYLITGLLGKGGMGVVYRARHADTGRAVALKAVKALRLASFAGLRQEIEFLREARHPGVVEVLDYDLSAGDPWYAMELLEGNTLGDWNREVWLPHGAHGSEAGAGQLPAVLRLYAALCEPLAFVHDAGIVHCDLKPANVFLRHGHQPVLMDFGLVTRASGSVGREALGVSGRKRGTIPYIAPESIRGQIPDARADVYALGCMLYESVTGHPPFVSNDSEELMEMHLSMTPTPASRRVSGVPPALDALLARALAKTQADRIGHAVDIGVWLADILAEIDPSSRRSSARTDKAFSRTHLFRPLMVGRASEMSLLIKHVSEVDAHRGGMIVITGESGIGKTFLAAELSQRAYLAGMRVVVGECNPRSPSTGAPASTGSPPLQPFRRLFEAIRDRCREGGPKETERLLGSHLGLLATYFPALSQLGPPPTPSPLPSMAARERLIGAVADVIATFSRDRRLLIAIDDLQWADDLSLAVLQHLDESYFRNTPAIVLGIYRSDEITPAVAALEKRSGVVSCRLERLGRSEVGEMIAGMLGMRDPPAAMIRFVHGHSEGIPFFAAEYLRALVDDGVLVRKQGTWSLSQDQAFRPDEISTSLPASLGDLIKHRIGQLEEESLVVAQAAAVAGRTFTTSLLSAVLDRPVEQVEQGLLPSVSRQIVKPGTQEYRFAHDKLREALYASVKEADRAHLHLSVARALADRRSLNPSLEDDHGTIAHHFREGGDFPRAVDYLEKAGQQALEMAANADAQRFFQEALELEASFADRVPPLRRARWERWRADSLFGLGAMAESAEALHRAAGLLQRPLPRRLVSFSATLLREVVRQFAHRRWPQRLLGAPEADVPALRESARVFDRLLQVSYFLGKERDAGLSIVLALNLAELVPADHELASTYASAAIMAAVLPAPRLAEHYFSLAEKILSRTPDDAAESWFRMQAGVYYLGRGQRDKARSMLDRTIELTKELRYFRRMDETRSARANLDILAGHHSAAVPILREMEEQSARRNDPQMLAWALLLQIDSLIMQRRDVPAAMLSRVRGLKNELARPEQAWIASVEAHVAWQAGDARGALEHIDVANDHASAGRPVHLYCMSAYGRVTEIAVALFEREPGDARAARAMRAACKTLDLASRIFPVARPMFALHQGTLLKARHKPERAAKTWLTAIRPTRAMHLPYHEARLHTALAGVLPATQRARAVHESIAAKLTLALEGAARESLPSLPSSSPLASGTLDRPAPYDRA